jgi:hypothetical protein
MDGTISSKRCNFTVSGIDVTINAENIQTISLDTTGEIVKFDINETRSEMVSNSTQTDGQVEHFPSTCPLTD